MPKPDAPLVGTRWMRPGYDPVQGPYNGYTVTGITNTAHTSPRHPPQVIYVGDNGNLWSLPLDQWPGKLIPEEPRQHDPYAELKAAAADPTKQVSADFGRTWWMAGKDWEWNLPPGCYQVRDKPKTKVKMWQWIYRDIHSKETSITSFFRPKAFSTSVVEVIGPALWTEIEVDDAQP
jgi:hypothetical protein